MRFRGPWKSKHEQMTDCATDTFWCITTSPGPAPMIRPTRSPTVTGMSHQPSLQARTPRVAHMSVNSASRSRTFRGMAPRLWLIM